MKAAVLACLATMAMAHPALPGRMNANDVRRGEAILAKRQANPQAAAGLTDIDILNFALSLEWLEGTFYQQGFQQFPRTDFQALGLSDFQIDGLLEIGQTEFDHASLLQAAIAQAGFSPAEPCEYNFGFTDAAGMALTASVLEAVGVGAYLFAAQLVADAGILTTAGSILTVEARHSSFLRTVLGQVAVPTAFDVALSPRMAFSLAAPFVVSCRDGSNLAIPPFPTLTQVSPAAGQQIAINQPIQFQSDALAQATHCAFFAGGVQPGGVAFAPIDTSGTCVTPQNVAGVVFVALTNIAPLDGAITDNDIMAGPVAIIVT